MLSPALAIASLMLSALPAPAHAQGEVRITQADALAGNVTPRDGAGFPVSLTQPGSYVLASNLDVPRNRNGVVVSSGNVSIDLNGFSITGPGDADRGIVGQASVLTIRNGLISGFQQDGIQMLGDFLVVEDMMVLYNRGTGVLASESNYSRIRNSTLVGNWVGGLICGSYCIVQGIVASQNLGTGIQTGLRASVQDNVASGNTADGIFCVACVVAGNAISGNGGHGVAAGGTIVDNVIDNNTGYGIKGRGGINATGYGHNTLYANNSGSVTDGTQMKPNSCNPACP